MHIWRLHGVGILVVALALAGWRMSAGPTHAATLQADGEQRWYRGNMHTHSYWSDGDDYLENIALWYRQQGYQFLVFSDHNTLANKERWLNISKAKAGQDSYAKLKRQFPDQIVEREVDGATEVRLKTFEEVTQMLGIPDQFLMIQGEEISDRFGRLPLHLNVHHVHDVITPRGGNSVVEVLQNNVDAVVAQRARTNQSMIVHVNHPNFGWGVTAEDLMQIVGENFFEVYNGHPGVHNSGDHHHASTDQIWDIILTRRIAELKLPLMFGLATDDGHNYHHIPSRASEPGRGWVMVLSKSLSPEALIESLETGRFYASSGVALTRVETSSAGIEVQMEDIPDVTYTTEFIGTRRGYDASSEPVRDSEGKEVTATRRYSKDVGEVFATVTGTTAKYVCQGDELYVRARVTSSRKHPNPSEEGEFERAWVQPAYGPAAEVP